MNFTIVGMGYVGLVNTVILASFNHRVIGYDINKEKISLLKQGVATIEEPELQDLLKEALPKIRFTTNAKDAIRQNNIFVICVDTPQGKDGKVDLTNYYNALNSIAENTTQNAVVIIRSTVPVGTNRLTKKYLEARSQFRFHILSMPDFLSEGSAVYDTINPSRLVIGASTVEGEHFAKSLAGVFANKKVPLIITSPENAELIKYASDAFFAVKISYINSLSRLCDELGGDIDIVSKGISLDPRIGSSHLKAGVGYGGSSFPLTTNDLCWLVDEEKEVELDIIKSAIRENEKQLDYLLNKIFKRFKSINNFKVAIFGVGYKGDSEDVRNSPAIPVIKALLDKGAYVNVYDPLAEDNFHKIFSRHTHITYFDYPQDTLKNVDFVVILNDSNEFKKLTANDYILSMKRPIIFDARNIYKLDALPEVEYHSIGRPTIKKK